MPVVDPTSPATTETSLEYYQAELKNARDRLYKLNQAINEIKTTGVASYQLDSGQSRQRVTRFDLPLLYEQIPGLMDEIRRLEIYLGEGKLAVKQVRPAW